MWGDKPFSIIFEENESSVMRPSYIHLDFLQFEFTENIMHDGNLLQRALKEFMNGDVSRHPDISMQHFNQLKEKVDKFFD